MSRLVVLDNEAVQALRDPVHPKHRQVLGHVQVVVSRKRRAEPIRIVVPTAVRAEAGWDRTSPSWAFANQLRISDSPLDTRGADTAAAIVSGTGVSVADAHVGAVVQAGSDAQVTIITSDPGDIRRVSGGVHITVVTV